MVHDGVVAERDNPPKRIGRYELCSKFASGGMASVYFGRILGSEGFSRVVAIKRMHAHLAEMPEFRAMFIDEARLAARISHPNVAQIIDLVSESGELMLVMGYIHGAALSALLKPGEEPLRVPIAVRIALDALYGLQAAHAAKDERGALLGIVHRDVSPPNILISTEGTAIVVDFGVAKAAMRLQTTREGEIKGKLRYMPPEQLRQDVVGPQTDVYALAAVLWEMLTGARLFTGASDAAVMSQVLEGAMDRPKDRVPSLPQDLDDIVMTGLSRDVSKRYPSARAMAEALEGLRVAATPGELAAVIATRARETLEARERAIRRIHTSDADVLAAEAGRVHDHTLTAYPQPHVVSEAEPSIEAVTAGALAPRTRARAMVAVGVALVLGGIATSLALFHNVTSPVSSTAPPMDAPATEPAPPPKVGAGPGPTEPSPPSSASQAPSAAPVSSQPSSASPPPQRSPAARPPSRRLGPSSDCAQNPKVLGPDGVYHVRRECLGR